MKAETVPDQRSYATKFRQSVALLVKAGETRTTGLTNVDKIAVYIAAAIALARQNIPGYDIASLLRNAADDLDKKDKS